MKKKAQVRTRIDSLSDAEKARFDEWADMWIEIGLRTGPADRDLFEDSARKCYEFAGIPWHGNVVWVDSPLVMALAAPIANYLLANGMPVSGDIAEAMNKAVHDSVSDSVMLAVNRAVAPDLHGYVAAPAHRTIHDLVNNLNSEIRQNWYRYIGGQFWVGGWWYGGAWTSFFRDVCNLHLDGDLWDRSLAYEGTQKSACWWWPHSQFIIVSERPTVINRELTDPNVTRGWGSHRLHCADGPAVAWPDGWGVWAWHGVRVPRQVIEAPDTLTPQQILGEENAEVRRVMIERFTPERLMREAEATQLQQDDYGILWRIDLGDDEPLVMVELENSSVEEDGSRKHYYLRVPPDLTTARAAVAWTFDMSEAEYNVIAAS